MKLDLNTTINLSLKIVSFSFVFLALVNLVGSNLLATQGDSLDQLTTQAIELTKQNALLQSQVSQLSSLTQIEQAALQAGFVRIESPIALTTPAPVALAH